MGSPLGPVLADLFMSKLENTVLAEQVKALEFYGRYVDDTFVIYDELTNPEAILNSFNQAHPSISFTCEVEQEASLAFLDVLLTRRQDGTIERRVYRKPTWVGQYTHFYSFVPLRMKRNLVHCLYDRAMKICSDSTLATEIETLANTFRQNGYPDRFLEKHLKPRPPRKPKYEVPLKPLYLRLAFKGDAASELLTKRLQRAIGRTYFAAKLHASFTNRPLIRQELKDKLPQQTTSMCVYQFVCSCGDSYIGRTTRQLSKRMSEHLPSGLRRGQPGSIRSSILAHVLNTGHAVPASTAFKPIYEVPVKMPKSIRTRVLATAEAIGIRINRPKLCVQKRFVKSLSLAWPDGRIQHPAHPTMSHSTP